MIVSKKHPARQARRHAKLSIKQLARKMNVKLSEAKRIDNTGPGIHIKTYAKVLKACDLDLIIVFNDETFKIL